MSAVVTLTAVPPRRAQPELWLGALAVVLLFGSPSLCSAQDVQGVLDDLDGSVRSFDSVAKTLVESAKGWVPILQGYARRLFMALATIQIAWTALQHSMSGEPHVGGALGAVLKEVVILGFFAILIDQGPHWGSDIILSLQEAGRVAAGGGHAVKPQHLLDAAAELGTKTIQESSLLSIAQSGLGMAIGGLAVLVCVAAVGGLTLVGWAQAWIVLGAGSILLGFGGSVWTRSMAGGYLRHALGAGVKLMVLELMQGVLLVQMQLWIEKANGGGLKLEFLATVLVSSIAVVIMMLTIPSYVSSIVTGAVMHAGESAVTRMAMAGAFLGGQVLAAKARAATGAATSIAGSGATSSSAAPGLVGAGGPAPSAAAGLPAGSAGAVSAPTASGGGGGGPSAPRASSVAATPPSPRAGGGAAARPAGRPSKKETARDESGSAEGRGREAPRPAVVQAARRAAEPAAKGRAAESDAGPDKETTGPRGSEQPASVPDAREGSWGSAGSASAKRAEELTSATEAVRSEFGADLPTSSSAARSTASSSGERAGVVAGSSASGDRGGRSAGGRRDAAESPAASRSSDAVGSWSGDHGGAAGSRSSASSLGSEGLQPGGGGHMPRGKSRASAAKPSRHAVKHEGRTRLERALERVGVDGEEGDDA